MDWPVREALIAYRETLRREATEAFQFDLIFWALTAPYAKGEIEAPEIPEILKRRGEDDAA